jgi:hypothetical protein
MYELAYEQLEFHALKEHVDVARHVAPDYTLGFVNWALREAARQIERRGMPQPEVRCKM